ncbi:MAG TPA: VWA domain-containing protein, partial [Blastocatellia bacterium]|nr:VWA domain-containing protein [Blastocatellia bacterium]
MVRAYQGAAGATKEAHSSMRFVRRETVSMTKTETRRAVLTCLAVLLLSGTAASIEQAGTLESPDAQSQSGRSSQSSTQAQNKPSKDQVVRISVTLVQVDAEVTDSKGNPIIDLKPDDFEILEDGRPQHITNFSYIPVSGASGGEVAPGAPIASTSGPPPSSSRIRPGDVDRTIAIVVDDLRMPMDTIAQTKSALKRFVDTETQPGDLVAIMRADGGLGSLQQFTTDKRQMYGAIDRIRYSLMGSEGASSIDPISRLAEIGGLDQAFRERREAVLARQTLGTLRRIVSGLSALPGRKALILVSKGFKMFSAASLTDFLASLADLHRDPSYVSLYESLREVIDLANRASVVIYGLDPRGLQVISRMPGSSLQSLSAADDVGPLPPNEVRSRLQQRSDGFYGTQDGLVFVASATGGFAVTNSNDLFKGLGKIAEDQKGYYLIGYVPAESTFEAVGGRPPFHLITVKVRRAGLHVRSRSGFTGVDQGTQPGSGNQEAHLLDVLSSPFTASGVDVSLTPLFGNTLGAGSFFRSLVSVDGRNITFTDEKDGWHKAVVELLAVTFGENGRPADQIKETQTIEIKGETYKRALERGLVLGINVPVKTPGAYQLGVAVRDVSSGRVGSANEFVEVPDVLKGELGLSGIILKSRTSPVGGEAAEAGRVLALAPLAADEKQSQLVDEVSKTTAGVRSFQRGKDLDLDYSVVVYNAYVDRATLDPRLEVRARLFKDGREVLASPLAELRLGDRSSLRRIGATGSLSLPANQAPGQYILQLTVTDKLTKQKHNTVTQWAAFEVVEDKGQ